MNEVNNNFIESPLLIAESITVVQQMPRGGCSFLVERRKKCVIFNHSIGRIMKAGASSFFRFGILLNTLIAVAHVQSATVSFQNNTLASPPDRLVRDVHGIPLVGQNYLAQLYWGTSPETLVAITAEPARFRVPTTASPGTWGGGTRSVASTAFEPFILQVRVWDSLAGATYEEASQNTTGAQYGQSQPFIFEPCPGAPAPGCDFMHNFQGFTLVTNVPPTGASVSVSFRNQTLPSPPDRLVRDEEGNPLVGTNYVAQLYAGNSPDTLAAKGAPAPFHGPITTIPGTWAGGPRQFTLPQASPVYLQVRVWDLLAGATYEQASANTTGGQHGKSEVFLMNDCGNPPQPGCEEMLNFRGFTLLASRPPGVLAIRDRADGGIDVLYSGTHTIEGAVGLRGPWTALATQAAPFTDHQASSMDVRFYRINDGGTNYSVNAVGFYRLSFCSDYTLIANQLNVAGGNTVTNIFKTPPERTRVRKFYPPTGGFISLMFLDGQWEGDLEMTLNPGEGAFVSTSMTSYRILGEVPLQASAFIPVGYSIISHPLPEAGPVAGPNGLGLPVREGFRIFQWDCPGVFIFNQYVDGNWEGDAGGATPIVGIGEAFYIFNGYAAFSWNRTFSVGP